MNNIDLMESDVKIIVSKGVVKFPEYEQLKNEAIKVAEYVSSIEVAEDTVKQAKKLLATVNKSVKNLEDRRIAIKKEILEPYNIFETQVKEIVNIVKDADTLVRNQVKELEEIERDKKRQTIEDIWNLRLSVYEFDFIEFDRFLKPTHLNKTVSVTRVEDEMIEFLEKVDKDVDLIKTLPNGKEILQEYIDCLDLTVSMSLVNERKDKEKKVNEIYEEVEVETYYFRVFNEKDAKLTEMLLNENKIKFEKGII